jgi:hypothetical protein
VLRAWPVESPRVGSSAPHARSHPHARTHARGGS